MTRHLGMPLRYEFMLLIICSAIIIFKEKFLLHNMQAN